MARASKGARHINVDGVAYRWRATGNDQYIGIAIWPVVLATATVTAIVGYDEAWSEPGRHGGRHPMRQIIVTNRIVRRVIEWARSNHGYDPQLGGVPLELGRVDGAINLFDAIRANDKWW